MNDTLKYIVKRFNVDFNKESPIEIRQWNRTIMAQIFKELGFKEGAEIGVAQGWYAEILCRENPGLKLHAVDVWDTYEGYNEYTNRIHRYYKHAQKILEPYNVNFIKKFSMDAVKDFKDGSLDFVFVDGAHDFKNVAMDICEWAKKVRIGGIVYGHDYKRWSPGRDKYVVNVRDVVQAYMYAHAVSPWFVLKTGIKDLKFKWDNPCWMFVRQEKDLIFLK